MTGPVPRTERVILVRGHESDDAGGLARFARLLPDAVVAAPGRALLDAGIEAQRVGRTVFVVPMTFGRDPSMEADAARTLRWLRRSGRAAALTRPFGDAALLTALLRAKADTVRRQDPGAALLIVARAADPHDDAELHRIAHLVRVHGAGLEVAVTTVERGGSLAPATARLRRLGFDHVVAVPAGFSSRLVREPDGPTDHAPLMSDASVATIVDLRVRGARYALSRGDDGIEAGLHPTHGHGHSHDHDHESSGLAVSPIT